MTEQVKTIRTSVSTGIDGLDNILRGGFSANCLYLISGEPGTGKTTLAMQFLLAGIKAGESCLYVTLSETRREILQVAESHGWDLSAIHLCELVPSEHNLSADSQLTVFNPSEFELAETTRAMIEAVRKFKPKRVVLDSLSELRLIAQGALRYRRQILALKQFFAGQDCTVLLLDDCTGGFGNEDGQLRSIAHGVISLEQLANEFGSERRRLRVVKLRGVSFRGGFHDFNIRYGGLAVFPRLIAAEHHVEFIPTDLPTGNAPLDSLLGGGIPIGTSTLLLGPAGTGKSTIATQFAITCAKAGMRAALFIFDENLATFLTRSKGLGMDVEPFINSGLFSIQQIDPAELSPGEFMAMVRQAVDGLDGAPAKMVVVDSLNGYLNAMPEEKLLTAQLHELLAYLGQQGVATLLNVTQSGMVGAMTTPVDTTYLADNVILFRYFESAGQVRKAISVVKKRTGPHESMIRELHVTASGIQIGAPLAGFQGVLTGVPTFIGSEKKLNSKVGDEA